MSTCVNAVSLQLDHTPLPDESVVDGAPTTGHRRDLVGRRDGGRLGTYPGVSRDVESDEVFVVLGGDASIAFDDGTPTIDLRPGSLVRLHAGQRTTWTVRETLRKVFIA